VGALARTLRYLGLGAAGDSDSLAAGSGGPPRGDGLG